MTVTSPTAATAQIAVDLTAAPGLRTVVAMTGTEQASFVNGFTILPLPSLVSVAPNAGAPGQQNLSIAIVGANTHFAQSTTQVSFGADITPGAITVTDATHLSVVIGIASNAAPGTRDVIVTSGQEVVPLAGAFTINGPPSITLVSPNSGQLGAQNLAIGITGQNTHFAQGATQINFGTGITVNAVTVANATSLTAQISIAANAPTGAHDVTVTTGAEVATATGGFTVGAPPAISAVNPNAGQQGQQNLPIAISGQNTHFVQGSTQASFGAGITVVSLTVTSAIAATAVVNIDPAATTGPRNVTLTSGSEIASLANGFTVQQAVSGPLTLNPSLGQQGQTLSVTITGQSTHFAQGQTQARFGLGVMVGSALAGDFGPITVTSPTTAVAQIAIVDTALPGSRTVTVQTGTEVVSGTNAFTVTGTPFLSNISPNAAQQGQTGSVTILGSYTNFAPGLSQVSFGAGVTVNSVTVNSATSLSAQISVSAAATPGLRNVTVQTGAQTATGPNGFSVLGPVTGPGPTVAITSPTEASEITAPTSVTGTATSPNLDYWTLEYQAAGASSWTQFATGTTASVTGNFDPSLLLNGNTAIRLTGVDTSGQTAATTVTFVVDRNLKIGIFTLSFNDLSIPVAGLPIQVIRTYDSRNKGNGDFGVGWTLDLKTVVVTTNGALGDNWSESSSGGIFPSYCVQATKPHVVTFTFTDGTTYEFTAGLSSNCQSLVPIQDQPVAMSFAPTGVTPPNAALTTLGNSQPYVTGAVPGPVTLTDSDLITTFDPDQYVLTLPDGRVLQVSVSQGLQKMTDLSGNTLTVTPSGITHSSGKSVTFARDAQNRITQITDPNGNTLQYAYNASGDLVTFTDQGNGVSSYTYDANHDLLTIVDPAHVQPIRNDYDSTGRLVSHTDAFGNTINYTHDLNTNQEIVTDQLGNITVNEYDPAGNIVKVTDADGGVTQRTYDADGNVTKETNALGNARIYTYDANNNRTSETDPLNHTTSYTYNSRNQVLTVKDANNHTTTNVYDNTGNLLSTTDAAGKQTTYTYFSNGLRQSMTDPTGAFTQYQYDASGNLIQQTDALNNVTAYTYDNNGNKKTETKTRTTPQGTETLLTSYQYDALNRLVQTTYPDSSTTQIQYNAIGKQSVTIDQLGRQTSYAYDLMGRLLSTTYPDSTSESSTYDADGRRVSSTDRNNRTTNYRYDPVGRLLETDYPDGGASKTQYDPIGEVTSVTDPNLNTTQYQYDAAGRRIQVIDALNHTTAFAYDAVGNQTQVTDANLHVIQYQYDALNRRTLVTYPDNTTDQTAYDAVGRTASKTDQANLATQYQYDRVGRLTQVTDALNQVTAYAYDEVGDRISQTDANGHVTKFEYDKLGRRTKRTLPAGQSESMTYDAAGNLKTKIDFNGKTTTYSYDALNRLTSKTPDSSLSQPVVSFAYTNSGQRQSMVDASGTTSYSYDLRDRLLQKVTPEGTLSYTYDLGGDLLSIRSSNTSGTSVNYGYDQLNRISTTRDNRLVSGTTTYGYDPVGNLQNYAYPNGVQSAYQYDALNRLKTLAISQGATALASYAYQLGPAGNRTQVSELGGRTVSYQYDNLYRLTQETIAGAANPAVDGTIGYQYDKIGNRNQRTSTVAGVPSANYSYDADDRLTSDTYDANGNTMASGSNTYAYDFENHLTGQNSGAVSIVYDGDGNRVAKTAGGVTITYLVDDRNLTGYAQVLEEISGGAVLRVYTYGLNRISESQASGTSFYGYDGHANVRMLTDATGAVTDRYDYDAFGNILSQPGTTPNVYLYSGEQSDLNLGFYYLRTRYYNQATARFQTADNFEGLHQDPRSLHKYTYGHNNPINQADPSGQITLEDTVLAITISNVLSQIEIIHLSGQRFAHANGNLNGASLSLRAGGEGSGLTGDFGFDIDWDFGPNQFCVVPTFDAGISVGSFAKTCGGASVAFGFYAGGNACEKQTLIERVGATTSFPLGLAGSIFSPLPSSYPFLGFVQNLAHLSGVSNWSVSIGYTGLQASSTFSSVAVSPMASYGSAVSYSQQPIPLSGAISNLRSSFGPLADAAVQAINAVGSLGRTFSEIQANASLFPSLFSPF